MSSASQAAAEGWPLRLMTAAMGLPRLSKARSASLKSCTPKGVGSMTSTTASAEAAAVMTGQETPGGASMRRSAFSRAAQAEALLRSALMRGGVIASPTRERPSRKMRPSSSAPKPMRPSSRSLVTMACGAQTAVQPPQPWHISENGMMRPPSFLMALNWQIDVHSPQRSQASVTRTGTSSPTGVSSANACGR